MVPGRGNGKDNSSVPARGARPKKVLLGDSEETTMFRKTQPSRTSGECVTAAVASQIEQLEMRLLFSTYTVTTLGDSAGVVTPAGAGRFNATTLRAAITAANAHRGTDAINFATALVGTIDLGSACP